MRTSKHEKPSYLGLTLLQSPTAWAMWANTSVKSTVEGTVLSLPIEMGSQVTEANNFNRGTTIATVADLGQMIFDGQVDEIDVDKGKEGTAVEISVGAIPDTTFQAVLNFVSPKGLSQNGVIQFEIKASVALIKEIFLRSGYSANASIKLREAKDMISLARGMQNSLYFAQSFTISVLSPPSWTFSSLSSGLLQYFKDHKRWFCRKSRLLSLL